MTDEEIKKALECCIKSTSDCDNCPYYGYDDDLQCFDMSKRDALDLINRQQAEIEKLNVELVGMKGACNSYKMHYDNAKAEIERLQKYNTDIARKHYNDGRAEAIKEFADRLKKDICNDFGFIVPSTCDRDIDNLVKEMVGEGK